MATLYLHIGMSKTGTSAIQQFCYRNKRALAEKGFCYPIFPKRYPRVAVQRNGHFFAEYMMRAGDPDARLEQDRIWNSRMNYFSRLFRRYSSVIISDETIWYYTKSPPVDMWERLRFEAQRRGFDLRVIAYLRRQDQFLCSWWAQKIKKNPGLIRDTSFGDILAHPDDYCAIDYYALLVQIAAVISKERITIRMFERGNFPDGDVCSDFLQLLGLRMEDGFLPPDALINTSIAGDVLEILHQFDFLPEISPTMRDLMAQAAIRLTAVDPESKRSLLSAQQRDELLVKYEESNRLVARDYLGSDQPLFTLPRTQTEPATAWTPNSPKMYASIIRYFGDLAQAQLNWMLERNNYAMRLRRIGGKLKRTVRIYADYLLLR